MNSCMHLDWLAIQYVGPIRDRYPFTVEKLPYSARQWKELYNVYRYGELWGHISTQSTLPTIPGDFYILKLENKYLYDPDLFDMIRDWEIQQNTKFHGFSRVDVCLDFQEFDNGMMPWELIRDFAGGKIDCLSKAGGEVRREASASDQYSYMSLGSKRSDVRVYLYNKSKEMREVKFKSWIQETDMAAGLDPERDIWRLEFSLTGEGFHWADTETGQDMSLTMRDLENDAYFSLLMDGLITKYFGFIEHSSDKNRYRHERIPLIKNRFFKIKRVYAVDQEDSNRADRIFIKKAMHEAQTSKQLRPEDRYHVVFWLYQWAVERGLDDYIHKLKELAQL